jgi:beta-glucosidase
MGREARAVGANYYGVICVNLLSYPQWGRAQETWGEDPFHVGAMGAASLMSAYNRVNDNRQALLESA